jgi:hypothetical protein
MYNIGLDGKTYYIHMTDHLSGMVFGSALQFKAPLLEWINQMLAVWNEAIKPLTT